MLAVAGRLPRAPRPLSVSCHVEFFNMAARKENLYSISASKMEPQERYCDHGSFLSFLPYSVGQKKVISQWKGITQRHGHKEVRVTGDRSCALLVHTTRKESFQDTYDDGDLVTPLTR